MKPLPSTTVTAARLPAWVSLLIIIAVLSASVAAPGAPAALASPQAPLAGNALQFDGTNDYVTFGQATTTLGAQTFTLETWFKRTGAGVTVSTGTGGVTAVPLLTKGVGESNSEGTNKDMNYFLGINSSNILVADFETYAACGSNPAGQNYPITGVTPIQNNVWNHVAVTYDGSTWRLYLNGILDRTLTIGCAPRYDSIQHAGLGTALNSTGAAAGYFAGALDEARIWSVARTQQQIQDNMGLELTSGTGLLGRWGLNDGSGTTATNSVAGSPNGTLTNGPTWVDGTTFAPPDALQLGSNNAYVKFADLAALNTATFTLETWFRRDGAGTAVTTGNGGVDLIPLIAKGTSDAETAAADINYFFGIHGTDSTLCADFEEAQSGTSPSLNHPVCGTTALSNGFWYHAAATYDGTAWFLYLNGVQEATLTVGRPANAVNISPAALGTSIRSNGATTQGYFNGTLDEVRIWNIARTQAQIVATINTRITGAQSGLLGRWGLDEGAGSSIHSTAGATIDGTITGSGWGWTNGAPFNISFTPPAAPSGLSATAIGAYRVDLAWTDNASNESNFEIERCTGASCLSFASLAAVGANAASYPDTSTQPLTDYCYRVRATNSGGASAYTDPPACVTTPAEGASALDVVSGTYVTFGDANATDLAQFTLETWFRRDGTGTAVSTGTSGVAAAIPLISNGAPEADNSSVDENYVLCIDNSTSTLCADFEEGASGASPGLNHPVGGVTPIASGTWYHAAVTYDGTTWRLYLNGLLEATLAVGQPVRADNISPTALATMLESDNTTHGFFDGALDEVRVWNYARTQAEIQGTINAQLTTPQAGLVARWGLNEGSGTAVNGTAGTAVNGTVTGTGYTWITPGAPFNLSFNASPGQPALVAPANGGTGVPTAPDLTVGVSDSDSTNLTVTFYGRAKSTAGPSFTLAVLPDTQYYTSRTTATTLPACPTHASIFSAQTRWIVDHQTTNNIAFVSHLGDVTDAGSDAQWQVADAAFDLLDAAGTVPYGVVVGNHDIGSPAWNLYDNYFGASRYSGKSWYGGHYGTDNLNHYETFSASDLHFIVLHIAANSSYEPDANALSWADDLLKADTDRRGIVIIHDLLNTSTSPGFTTLGQAVFDALKDNPNLFLMLGGHLDTEGQRMDPNTINGNPIYSLRSDYQSRSNGGDSWMRLMEFRPADNLIQVRTFAPCRNGGAGEYETDASSEFTLSYNMSGTGAYAQIGTPQSATSGGTATVNWPGLAQGTEYEWYVTVGDGNTTTTGPTWSFTTGTGDNNPPTVTQPTNQTSAEGQVISLQVAASDQDGDTLSYSATGLPAGLTIGAGTGLIAGTISTGAAAGSPYNVTVTVSDGKGGSTPTSFTWTVEASGTRPCGDDPALVGCWLMDEGGAAVAADGGALPANNVTFVGAPSWTTGQSGGAVSLNGTSQYGTTPDEASLDIVNQITLAAWIKPSRQATQDLIKKAAMDATDGYEITLASADVSSPAPKKVFVRFNQATSANTYRVNSVSDYPFDGNTWMHVAATYDGATIRLYINGIEESSLAASIAIATNNLPLSMGAQSDATRFFQGALDQARVYNRALSAQEIAGLVGGSLPPSGLTCTDLQTKPATTTTGEKPQSKVWRYAGAWWAVFPTNASGASSAGTWLWKLVGTTWTEVLKLSDRTDVKADVKVTGDLIHALLYAGTNTQLVSAQYNSGTGTYALWSVRPAASSLSLPNSEIATIDIDSTGRMWLATRAGDNVPPAIVVYYSDSPYGTWNGPITLVTGIIANDDIAVVTALPGKIGVLWGNENASVQRFGFRTHIDGTDPGTWTADEVPASQSAINGVGTGMADDHLNVAVASDGTLYAAVKTSYDTSGYPKIALLVRRPGGTWDNLYGLDESGTRPIVLLDEANGVLTVIYTSSEGNNPIVYRQSALGTIAFDGKKTLQAGSYNDVSSTKGNYTAELVTIFSDGSVTAGEICRPAGYPPQPPVPTIARSAADGDDVRFTWPKVTLDTNNAATTVLRYQVYRSLLPYFEPGDGSSLLPLDQPTALEYDDLDVVPSTAAYYYLWRAANAVGPSADSKRTGKFTFTLTPGTAP